MKRISASFSWDNSYAHTLLLNIVQAMPGAVFVFDPSWKENVRMRDECVSVGLLAQSDEFGRFVKTETTVDPESFDAIKCASDRAMGALGNPDRAMGALGASGGVQHDYEVHAEVREIVNRLCERITTDKEYAAKMIGMDVMYVPMIQSAMQHRAVAREMICALWKMVQM